MHAFKGGWIGQTFALATHNDSGGKKARIRRSKEERKTMVETFIKKYQNSNDGNFPSLNLTHKEVGGSFYTVREIVREIIQENRVLGPAKLLIEEQNINNVLEHYPLGSIAIEPQSCLSPVDETHIISHITSSEKHLSSEEIVESSDRQSFQPGHHILDSKQVDEGSFETAEGYIEFDKPGITEAATYPIEDTSDGPQLYLSGQFLGPDCQKFDNEMIGKGIQETEGDEESNEPKLGSLVSVHHEEISEEQVQESSEDQFLHFGRHLPGHQHLRSIGQQAINGAGASQATEKNDIDSLDMENGGRKQMEASNTVRTHVKPEIVVEKFPLRPVAKKIDGLEGTSEEQSQVNGTMEKNGIEQDRVHVLENDSSLTNLEVGEDIVVRSLKKNERFDETAILNVTNSSLEGSNCSTTKETLVLDINDVAVVGAEVSSLVEMKPVNSPTAVNEKVNNIKTSVSDEKSIPKNTVGVKDKLNSEHKSSSKKGSKSTLDRINLETWEGASEKSSTSEINPLLAFFKSFLNAFLKFWTE